MRKTLVVAVVAFFAGAAASWAYLCFGKSPRAIEPVTYKLDWWGNQSFASVSDFRVEVLPGHALNLMNHTALLKITIQGEVNYPDGHWRPEVKKVHASERFVPNPTAEPRVSDIDFMPVVSLKEDETYKGTLLPYEISFEHAVNTFDWGPNTIVLSAGGKEHVLVLHQRK